ncbi:MAG TPA: DUF2889 domain-containing protein [Methylomirabilota bacterium]|jgi:hypothetical protein|nr:DUF2889 domain-containing protein [Methylomirabilota bacterium]
MTLASPYLGDGASGGRYQRTVHGWVDAPREDTFAMTVRIVDPRVGIELAAETTPSPEYAIRTARGRVLVGEADRIGSNIGDAMAGLAGLTMTAGFGRAAREVAGSGPGAPYFVDAAIEVARLARQVTRLPASLVARHRAEGARGAWRLDRQGWVDIPGSCFTYRAESERLFEERVVTSPVPWVLYGPPAGAVRVFNRTKVGHLETRPDAWHLGQSMFDEVHSFQLWWLVDPVAATVVDAGVSTPRLPYQGLCSEPQARVRTMVGQRVDAGLRGRLGELVGGPSGCAQLYDLSTDLLKLLAL